MIYQGNDGLFHKAAVPGGGKKEYVALLTQSGTEDPHYITSGSLTVGVTYQITTYNSGDDFTNVGAPSNANGVYFVATGTTPTNWTHASHLGYDTAAPKAKVLLNEIGNIWLTRVAAGSYEVHSNGLFNDNTTVFITQTADQGNGAILSFTVQMINDSQISIETSDLATGYSADGWLRKASFKIEIYN